MKMTKAIAIISSLGLFTLSACEPPPPTYILKAEVGEASYVHHDSMKEQPKYIKVKKTNFDKKKAIQTRRALRDKARGIYKKQSKWDY